MTSHIKINPAEGTWVARADGAIIAESKNAQELVEGRMPGVIYFPRKDIGMEFMEKSEKTSYCPHKGQASYYSIMAESGKMSDAAWCYDTPKVGAEGIKGHVAFYPDLVVVEKL